MPDGTTVEFGELQKNWGWLFAMGIISVILGTIGLGMTLGLTLASVLFFGVLLLINGGLQFFQAFKCKGWKGIVWHILIALLYVVAGIAIVRNPLFASAVMTLVLAWTIIAVGVVRSVIAFQHRGTNGWIWSNSFTSRQPPSATNSVANSPWNPLGTTIGAV